MSARIGPGFTDDGTREPQRDAGRAEELHRRLTVVDGLNASWHLNPAVADGLISGGVAAVHATVAANHDALWVLRTLSALYEMVAGRPDIAVARSVAEIREARRVNRLAYVIGFQDTEPVGDDLGLYRLFHTLGLRVVQLTYNFENRVGCGCQCAADTGLTPFGRDTVARLNDLGILIDLSHCGIRTASEAVERSSMPVAVTHANSTTTLEHPRNKPPELLRAVASGGGVVGAVAFPALLRQRVPPEGITVDEYVRAIDTLVQEIGVDHVGVGPDFMQYMPEEVAATVLRGLPPEARSAMESMPPLSGFSVAAEFPGLTNSLLRRGYSDEDIAAIMGENWLRLYDTVWSNGFSAAVS